MMLIRVEAASLSPAILYTVNIKHSLALASLMEYYNIASFTSTLFRISR